MAAKQYTKAKQKQTRNIMMENKKTNVCGEKRKKKLKSGYQKKNTVLCMK
jgi:hypothetical protein